MTKRTQRQIATDIRGFIAASFPKMKVRVRRDATDQSRLVLSFIDSGFTHLYPAQRLVYSEEISLLIPGPYHEAHIRECIPFFLAPGEKPEDLPRPDEARIKAIAPVVMKRLRTSGFFQALDDRFCPAKDGSEPAWCWGDFCTSKSVLTDLGCPEDAFFDIFHVLMEKAGFCDCEILFNVWRKSRFETASLKRTKKRRPKTYAMHHDAKLGTAPVGL